MSAHHTSGRPVSVIFAVCFGVSIALHLVSVLMIAFILSNPAGSGKINYLEMSDLVPVSPGLPPATLSAAEQDRTVPVPPLPEPLPDPAKPDQGAESDAERTVAEDIRKTPLGLGMAYGFVSSLGSGATLREDIREYYLVLVEKINRVWWERAGTLAETVSQDGIAVIVIRHDGTLLDRVMRVGTGSPDADRALLESIELASPLPPLPESYGQDVFTAPLKITAPSRLLRVQTYQ